MTVQTPEILIHRDLAYDMYDLPLESYLRYLRKSKRPQFTHYTTSCYRGYIGVWEIYRSKLWLVDMHDARWPMHEAEPPVAEAFPHVKLPVEAKWFSGDLRCAEGAFIERRWAGFGMSRFERDRLIGITKGEVIYEELRINPPNPVYYTVASDGTRAFNDQYNAFDHLHDDLYAPEETPHGLRFWIAEGEDLLKADLSEVSPRPARSYLANTAGRPE